MSTSLPASEPLPPTAATFEIIAALPTPFTTDGAVDLDAYQELLGRIAGTLDAALVLGTTGEFLALDADERLKLVDRAVEVLGAGRVIGQVGSVSVRESLRLAGQIAERGVRRIACLTPYYFPFTAAEVENFFRSLRSELTGIDLFGYFFAERTGVALSAPDVVAVIDASGLQGAKISGSLTAALPYFIDRLPDRKLYSGADDDPVGLRELGAAGVISGLSCLAPELYRRLMSLDEAAESVPLRNQVKRLAEACGVSLAHVKAGMRERSAYPWSLRIPHKPLTGHERDHIAAVLARIDDAVPPSATSESVRTRRA